MTSNTDAIRKVLDKLVTPKYPAILDYEIEMEMDENNSLITLVDIFFDKDGYWKAYFEEDYDYPGEFEADIEFAVKDALKYLGLNNRVYTAVYVFGEDDSDAGD